jgi:hypothetical protein
MKLITLCPILRVLVCKFNCIVRVTDLRSQIFDPDGIEVVMFVKMNELDAIVLPGL